MPAVLDACCGARKFWFNPRDARVLFVDWRSEQHDVVDDSKACGTRRIKIDPDRVVDFRDMPFGSDTFGLVVFDPPHIKANRTGRKSRVAVSYGTLDPKTWRHDLAVGFRECFRVLKPGGVLVFKWAETNIKVGEVLALSPEPPLFGNRMPKLSGTHWVVFMKPETQPTAATS